MSLFISSLNTGSNGNSFYIGNTEDAVLIDVGLSCKETELRLSRLGLDPQKIKAIFITHEHSDHIKGLPVFSKKYQIPVYITEKTLTNGRQILKPHLTNHFYGAQTIAVGSLTVNTFPKIHDAIEPHSFTVSDHNVTVGVFTDLGDHCENLVHHFKTCNAAFLEANFDDDMLENGRYPYFLKQRIKGGKGHLSNKKALDLFVNHRPEQMSHLFLAHLSKDNNCATLVENLFKEVADGVEIVVASRFNETAIYQISSKSKSALPAQLDLHAQLSDV
jgi:phosphoribosyl 1,2-cyclic phosphodiesterase